MTTNSTPTSTPTIILYLETSDIAQTPEFEETLKAIPDVIELIPSSLYSYQGSQCPAIKGANVILIDMALRYQDGIRFIHQNQMNLVEIHSSEPYEENVGPVDKRRYASFDELVQIITAISRGEEK